MSTDNIFGCSDLLVAIAGVAVLVDAIGSQQAPVDLTKWIGFWSYDVMNDLAFGGGTEMIRDGDVDGLWHLLEAGQRNSIILGHLPWLGSLFLRLPYFASDLKAFRAHAKKCALQRKHKPSPYKDLFYYLIDEDDANKHPPSVVEVINDGGLAIIAGSDTTSSAVTNLFYYLLRHPVAFRRLQSEIDFLGDDILDFTKQSHLPYLNSALNECLRLLPPVLSGSQRAPERGTGGASIGPYFIPEGTNVFIPTYSVQRDPRFFYPLPESFIPERWLPPEQREALEPSIFNSRTPFILNTAAFTPFSIGTAGCAGKSLAWMEMRMLVCLIMQRYNMHLADFYDPEQYLSEMKDYFIMIKGELPIVLTPRIQQR
ncbi:high nitrogen upregulated cytochrome P450 monooxygenase 2 [Coprinopsis cinerea okayama7|uniref:High nitrogen upregulated cytochrome P450 monooxygenase 2 n=1 Tax=Coprinopsis cinerea (strain Okayama-7 / 130 / ATCC MYA-4618 / FGSC 9003) TaxID=240176 RepID=A8NU69_COPC7|nr:high nitrogen upregulated cytochrome P450 monooxygenase 2 [Coprinopsis cinerea okayama7\|eukprot:XP_001836389.2 high nitrogen upregulated cytochrome P450 monooxygenase 2 [Coprinopsis cinerea okayama7\